MRGVEEDRSSIAPALLPGPLRENPHIGMLVREVDVYLAPIFLGV
jgi:hypothetical protein